jgi:predicted RNA binding protein YcfA (HicA-like mRNA interferase family)
MIKRTDLVRHLRRHGCTVLRQGSRHELWVGPSGAWSTVPRHREIPLGTARAICQQLGIPGSATR